MSSANPREPFAVVAAKVLFALFLLFTSLQAFAGGPRFVAGQGWGAGPGSPIGWNTNNLLYYTDQGPLSASVTNAQANALVAAAAAVWNVPTAAISLGAGGTLAEDVSTANTTSGSNGVVFPADVQISNEGSVPVAILYDADGGLTDLLLGTGASDPSGCRQNTVVGDIDDLNMGSGHIQHATLILNGRCVGSAPEQLTEMQYHLARAFGRILGLSWAQTNDNVFTARNTVTPQQMANWPLMHPMDVVCGTYAYQCMPDPFTLRVDDLNSLGYLYPVWFGNVPAGKRATSDDAFWEYGILYFPTGQGMNMQNFTTRRQNNGVTEDWELTSSVSGFLYQQSMPNLLTGVQAENSGTTDPFFEGAVVMRRVPLNGLSNIFMISEPINPLYTGDLAVGPYVRPPVQPSGASQNIPAWSALPGGDLLLGFLATAGDAANSCFPGSDGTETAPATLDASGWQTGQVCAWQHNSWWAATIVPGHTWTFEAKATDESGAASMTKLQPIVGAWNTSDPTGSRPTVASSAVAFNSLAPGVTQVRGGSGLNSQTLRLSVSDQFGEGRPDFTYVARFLYVTSVLPAKISSTGGQIAISGMGFAAGNQVSINGVAAQVVSVTPTTIIATAPSVALARTRIGQPLTVAVTDPVTGGSASDAAAVSYVQAPALLQQVSAPASLSTGTPSATPFAVRVLTNDGSAPVANAMVRFTVVSGAAQLGLCGAQSGCTVFTDSNGLAQTTIAGITPGTAVISATEVTGGATVQLALTNTDAVRSAGFLSADAWFATGGSGSVSLRLGTYLNTLLTSGAPIVWSTSAGLTLSAANAISGADGTATATVAAASVPTGYTGTVTACAWVTVCTTWTLRTVDAPNWRVKLASGAGQSVAVTTSLAAAGLQVTDAAGHALTGAPVQVFQRVQAWTGNCGSTGRCAAAPVLTSAQASLVSDAFGQVAVQPLQVAGVSQTVQIAISTGTQGFVAFTLVKHP